MVTDQGSPLVPHSRAPASQLPAFLGGASLSKAATLPRSRRQRSRWFTRLRLFLLLVGAVCVFTSALVAQAAPLRPAASSGNLRDYGGSAPTWVQHDPKVYLVFWGPKWVDEENQNGTITYIEQAFQTLAGSAYNNILSQYTDNPADPVNQQALPSPSDWANGNYVHNDVELMDAAFGGQYPRTIDLSSPPSSIDIGLETPIGVIAGAQVRQEADREIAANHWVVDRNTQIIVFPQQGTTYNPLSLPGAWCGMHAFNSIAANNYAYAVVQFGDQNGCSTLAPYIASTAVHEYAEMATDPVIRANAIAYIVGSGWHRQDLTENSPQEIADLCEGQFPFLYTAPNGSDFRFPLLWSNAAQTCVTANGIELPSSDFEGPYTGKHTVQGAMLNAYALNTWLGNPTSEEYAVIGGHVQHFDKGYIFWNASTGATTVTAYSSGGGSGGGGTGAVPAPPGGASPPSGYTAPTAHHTVTTFGSAPGYGAGGAQVGTLYAGTNYVYCAQWGSVTSDSAGNYNHWWLWTDLDTGGQGWVSAYYLSLWGSDVAKDDSGVDIPACWSGTAPTGLGTTIATIAKQQLGGTCGAYYHCEAPGEWCSDFARWVWAQAGANASGLNAGAASFYDYGRRYGTLSSTPHVGDAIVYGYNSSTDWAAHVAIVTSVDTINHTITDVGGNERGGAGVVASDGPYNWTVGGSPTGQVISGYISPAGTYGGGSGGGGGVTSVVPAPPGGASPPSGYTAPTAHYTVSTFGSAPGYGAGGAQVGTLYAGTNYVFCRQWGSQISDSAGNYNHWWLWTDLDTGGKGWVSAYYLSLWGNDVAKDNSGVDIPACWSGTGGGGTSAVPAPPGGASPPSGYTAPTAHYTVSTFANAPGYGAGGAQVGTLYAGTNYVFCKEWGSQISDSSGNYNHWWLWTDLDIGGKGWVSAYYLSLWGNDVAKDDSGNVIPTCWPGTAPTGSYSKWWVTTFGSAPGYYGAGSNWKQVGTLYAATNYVFCKAWGPRVSDSSGNYNHWWLWTDLDTGGQGWVSAYYLSKWGNDVAKNDSGTVIPNC